MKAVNQNIVITITAAAEIVFDRLPSPSVVSPVWFLKFSWQYSLKQAYSDDLIQLYVCCFVGTCLCLNCPHNVLNSCFVFGPHNVARTIKLTPTFVLRSKHTTRRLPIVNSLSPLPTPPNLILQLFFTSSVPI